MAAGLGFKTFAVGEVLSAANVNGYLMQGVLVFANATARDAAITSPQEGQFAYLKDTNVTTYYTGSAWANLDTTGMTNPMTTTGDTIYSSSGSTPARLGIGTTGQVLTVAGGVPSWATPAGGGGKVLQVVSVTYSTQSSTSSTTYQDSGLTASITPSAATSKILVLTSSNVMANRASAGTMKGKLNIVRGATEILGNVEVFRTGDGSKFQNLTVSYTFLDSPNTTSSTTYKQQYASNEASTEVYFNIGSTTSTITLLEIGA
jgi:hypothetical protein